MVADISNDVLLSRPFTEISIKGASTFYCAKIRTIDCFILSAELRNCSASSMKVRTLDAGGGGVLQPLTALQQLRPSAAPQP